MLPPSKLENENTANSSIRKMTPPPDIKSRVDKAARFLALIEPQCEKRVIADNPGLPGHGFLYDGDVYHAYYQDRVSELRAQNVSAENRPKWLTDEVLESLTCATTVNQRWSETLEWYKRFQEMPVVSVVSPLTGELIPVGKMFQHMRDPNKYKEEKERLFAKIRKITPNALDDDIPTVIAGLARTRSDIFGTTEEEFLKAVKAEFESIKPVLDLDAISAEDEVTLLSPPPLRDLAPNAQHSTPGINRPMGEPMSVKPTPPGSQFTPPPQHDEPEPKRQRLDDPLLVPEDEFLAQHPGPGCINVWVPQTGQKLEISVESPSEQSERED